MELFLTVYKLKAFESTEDWTGGSEERLTTKYLWEV
jgi:hypothetical protein